MASTAIAHYPADVTRPSHDKLSALCFLVVTVLLDLEDSQNDTREETAPIRNWAGFHRAANGPIYLKTPNIRRETTGQSATYETATSHLILDSKSSLAPTAGSNLPTTTLQLQGSTDKKVEDWVYKDFLGQLHGRLNKGALALLPRRLHRCVALFCALEDILRILQGRNYVTGSQKGANVCTQRRICRQVIGTAGRILRKSNRAKHLVNLIPSKKATVGRALELVLSDAQQSSIGYKERCHLGIPKE